MQKMIGAQDKSWDSPTTLYIARRLRSISGGKPLSVMDMGCGDGRVLEYLVDYGYDLYGYDFSENSAALRSRMAPYFGTAYDRHFRIAADDRSIPFEDNSFDVIFASQVFEHVRFLDRMLQECTRVLKPEGVVLAIFPLATTPIETHIGIPFAHWIPPGPVRVQFLRFFYALRLRPRFRGSTSLETAREQDLYLQERTFYHFMNEILSLAAYFFHTCQCETELLIRAKRDLLKVDTNPIKRWLGSWAGLLEGRALSFLVTHLVDAAFCMAYPKKI